MLPGRRIPSREISISGPAAIAARPSRARRRETRRKNTCNRTPPVFLFREWNLPLSSVAIRPATLPRREPADSLPTRTTLHSRIRNYRESKVYTGHSWRHNEPRPFVNECALVYARAITRCPPSPGGDRRSGWRRQRNERERGKLGRARDKLCPLSIKSRLIVVRLIFMSVYRGNRCLNERRCP